MRLTHYFISTLAAFTVFISVGLSAHEEKSYDKNGGHYDENGNYHCHLDGCFETSSRYQYRSRSMSNRDDDLYYNEEDWPYWQQLSGSCKTMRTYVLETTSKVPVTWTNPRECEIREGLWVDEYTGEEFTRAASMEVDHVISPKYANAANGYQWDYDKRLQFSNDPYNLIPVGRESASKKRERGIGGWQPRAEFLCEYAKNWKEVSEKYDLDLFAQDTSRINKIRENCDSDSEPRVEEN